MKDKADILSMYYSISCGMFLRIGAFLRINQMPDCYQKDDDLRKASIELMIF